jgi:hypothetical protein
LERKNPGIIDLRFIDLIEVFMPLSPVRYTPEVEQIGPDEDQTIRELADTLLLISEKTFADTGHALRSVHAKSHGIIEAELDVLPGLAPHCAQGLFARSARYPVVMRLSTIAGDILDDAVSIPRGMAIKILDVPGDRLPGSEGDATQDFLMADGPAFSAPNAGKFLASLKLLAKTTDRAQGLKKALSTVLRGVEAAVESVGAESALLKTLGGHRPSHILGEVFYSQAPIRYGDYIAKMSLAPASPELLALRDVMLDIKGDRNALRAAVRQHFATRGGVWDLRAQLCTDLSVMPVEDASVVWPEDGSPYVTVGRITAAPQDTWSDEKIRRVDDGMSFSPWHGIAAHQPLGSVMRARNRTYRAAASFRSERNGCPMHEPTRQSA